MAFSGGDGTKLATVGLDLSHTVAVYDWAAGVVVSQVTFGLCTR